MPRERRFDEPRIRRAEKALWRPGGFRRGALAGLLALLVLAALPPPRATQGLAAAPRPRVDSLVVLHTNDIHSHLMPFLEPSNRHVERVGGAAARAELIGLERERTPDLLLLDAGDLVQGTPIYNLFHGVPETKTQAAMRYDAAALGNHDLDDGPAAWLARQRDANYPTLSANVFAAADSAWSRGLAPVDAEARATAARWVGGARVAPGARLAYLATPYVTRTWRGVRIAIFGLTTRSLVHIVRAGPNGGVAVADPIAVARRLVPALRAKADVVIALTHIGLDEDKRLAEAVPGIDLIVGGHSHTRLFRPILAGTGAGPWSGGTTIVQAGSWGEYVGRAAIALVNGHPSAIRDRLLTVRPDEGEDGSIVTMLRAVGDSVRARTGATVFTSKARVPAPSREEVESALGDFVADAIREAGRADVGLVNNGGVRAPLPEGRVTLGDVMTILPFTDQVVVVPMPGDRLRGLLDFVAERVGKGGYASVSGLAFEIRGDRAANIRVGGRALEGSRVYRVATVDYLYEGGDGYAMLAKAGEAEETGVLLSEAATEFLRRHPGHSFRRDGRVVWQGGSRALPGLGGR